MFRKTILKTILALTVFVGFLAFVLYNEPDLLDPETLGAKRNLRGLIEQSLGEFTGASVRIGAVEVAPERGEVRIRDVVIRNPGPLARTDALTIAQIVVEFDPAALSRDVLVLRSVGLSAPRVNYERAGGTTNLQQIRSNIVKAVRQGPAAVPDGVKRWVSIDYLEARGVVVAIRHDDFPQGLLAVPVPDLRLVNIGRGGGVSLAEATNRIFSALAGDAARSALAELDRVLRADLTADADTAKLDVAIARARTRLAALETTLGPDSPEIAAGLAELAALLQRNRRDGEAEDALRRRLALLERIHGRDSVEVAKAVLDLGHMAQQRKEFAEAEALIRRGLAILGHNLAPASPDSAAALSAVQALQSLRGVMGPAFRSEEAEALERRRVDALEATLGPDHPAVAAARRDLAHVLEARGLEAEALAIYRRITARIQDAPKPTTQVAAGVEPEAGGGAARDESPRGGAADYRAHSSLALKLSRDAPDGARSSLEDEAFRIAERARAGLGAIFAPRPGPTGEQLAAAMREREATASRLGDSDKRLAAAATKIPAERDAGAEAGLRREAEELRQRVGRQDADIARRFPDYAEAARPTPLALVEAQALLRQDEAMVAFVVTPAATSVFALRRDRVVTARIELAESDLAAAVAALRAGLEPARDDGFPPFPAARAHELYAQLFGPVASALAGARHVFVVTDRVLDGLPLGALLVEPPAQATFAPGDLAALRAAPWLGRRMAIAMLPAATTLAALRRAPRAAPAPAPFLGVGDPRIPDAAPQPGSAAILAAFARAFNAPPDAILVGDQATDTALRNRPLQRYRVLALAAPCLLEGSDRGQPALALTPPAAGGAAGDDGQISASGIAQLRLDADLVVLPSCSTRAAEGAGGATQLARAFITAGARTLLVSHWPARGDAGTMLATVALTEGIGRAEALRRTIAGVIDGADREAIAHPSFWASVMVVGEAAAGR